MALTLTDHSLFSKDKFFPLRGFFYAQPDMPPHKQEFTEVIFILKGKVLHYSDIQSAFHCGSASGASAGTLPASRI